MDDLPPWEDDPTVTVVCPYCFLKHDPGPGKCSLMRTATAMLATLSEEQYELAMSGD